MGTRADFYIKDGDQWEWLGSTAYDGYEVASDEAHPLRLATTADEFKAALAEHFIANAGSVTQPEQGWPWPWNDSKITDYGYVFENGALTWADRSDWPDMSAIKNVTFGPRSGLLIISA